MSESNYDTSKIKKKCKTCNHNTEAILEDKIVELERSLSQVKQNLRNKESLVQIQTDQLKKMEEMYKKALDEYENLNYTSKKTSNDLENLKIISKEYEQCKQTRSIGCQMDLKSNECTACTADAQKIETLVASHDVAIRVISGWCSYMAYQNLANSNDNNLNSEINALKDISLKLIGIGKTKEATEIHNKDDCNDCPGAKQETKCIACEVKSDIITLLELEIADLRQQVLRLQLYPTSFVDAICSQSELCVSSLLAVPQKSSSFMIIINLPTRHTKDGSDLENTSSKFMNPCKITSSNPTISITKKKCTTPTAASNKDSSSNMSIKTIDSKSSQSPSGKSVLTTSKDSSDKIIRNINSSLNPEWIPLESNVLTVEPILEEKIKSINYDEHLKLLEEENDLLTSSVIKLKRACKMSTDNLTPCNISQEINAIEQLKKQMKYLRNELAALKKAFENHVFEGVDKQDSHLELCASNQTLTSLDKVQKDLHLLYLQFDSFQLRATKYAKKSYDLSKRLAQNALIESRQCSPINKVSEENEDLKRRLKIYIQLDAFTSSKVIKEFFDFKHEFSKHIAEIQFLITKKNTGTDDHEAKIRNMSNLINEMQNQLRSTKELNQQAMDVLNEETSSSKQHLVAMDNFPSELNILKQRIVDHVEDISVVLAKYNNNEHSLNEIIDDQHLLALLSNVGHDLKHVLQKHTDNKTSHEDHLSSGNPLMHIKADFEILMHICNRYIKELKDIKIGWGHEDDGIAEIQDVINKFMKHTSDVKNLIQRYREDMCRLNERVQRLMGELTNAAKREENNRIQLQLAQTELQAKANNCKVLQMSSQELDTTISELEVNLRFWQNKCEVLEAEMLELKNGVSHTSEIELLTKDRKVCKQEDPQLQKVNETDAALKINYALLLEKYEKQSEKFQNLMKLLDKLIGYLDLYKDRLSKSKDQNKLLHSKHLSVSLDLSKHTKIVSEYKDLKDLFKKECESFKQTRNDQEDMQKKVLQLQSEIIDVCAENKDLKTKLDEKLMSPDTCNCEMRTVLQEFHMYKNKLDVLHNRINNELQGQRELQYCAEIRYIKIMKENAILKQKLASAVRFGAQSQLTDSISDSISERVTDFGGFIVKTGGQIEALQKNNSALRMALSNFVDNVCSFSDKSNSTPSSKSSSSTGMCPLITTLQAYVQNLVDNLNQHEGYTTIVR